MSPCYAGHHLRRSISTFHKKRGNKYFMPFSNKFIVLILLVKKIIF
ncbi:hypothetical protein ACINWC743_2366 [Acinetobacter sp. WC-743]|nr:hypothetical protein ACINWC743_2366 [Acinetobacter sp. WC-743]